MISSEHAKVSRLDVRAAWVVGIALPLLETLRRRTDFSDIPAYVDDFIFGGIMLWAAWAASRRRWYGNGLLTAAWGILCGGMYYSFMGQLAHVGTDISGLPSAWVVVVKGGFLAFAIASLIRSVRRRTTESSE